MLSRSQDQETSCGKCPLCCKELTPAQLYREEDVRPPWWHAQRAADAAKLRSWPGLAVEVASQKGGGTGG